MNTDDVNVSANLDDNASAPLKKLLDLLNDYVKKVGEAQNAEQGSENSTKSVGNAFSQLLGPLGGVVGSLGGLAAGFFSAKAALDGFWAAITEADKLDDLHDKTGLLASDLAELSYAAKIGGSSLDGLLAAY